MIHASNTKPYQTSFTNGDSTGEADMPVAKGGEGRGFGPHELVEAAITTCMAITARKYAQDHDLSLASVHCAVHIDRSEPEKVKLMFDLRIEGNLTPSQERELRETVVRCPVTRTLTGLIALESTT